MCRFITVALPKSAETEKVARLAKEFDLAWEPIINKSVLAKLESGSRYFYTTTGMCDCDSLLGHRCLNKNNKLKNFDTQVARFKRKGWTQTKIKNWLAEKQKSIRKVEAANNRIEKGTELRNWQNFITEVVNTRLAKKIYVLLHMYHGDLETERIKIVGCCKIALANLNSEVLLNIEEDRLYQFANV